MKGINFFQRLSELHHFNAFCEEHDGKTNNHYGAKSKLRWFYSIPGTDHQTGIPCSMENYSMAEWKILKAKDLLISELRKEIDKRSDDYEQQKKHLRKSIQRLTHIYFNTYCNLNIYSWGIPCYGAKAPGIPDSERMALKEFLLRILQETIQKLEFDYSELAIKDYLQVINKVLRRLLSPLSIKVGNILGVPLINLPQFDLDQSITSTLSIFESDYKNLWETWRDTMREEGILRSEVEFCEELIDMVDRLFIPDKDGMFRSTFPKEIHNQELSWISDIPGDTHFVISEKEYQWLKKEVITVAIEKIKKRKSYLETLPQLSLENPDGLTEFPILGITKPKDKDNVSRLINFLKGSNRHKQVFITDGDHPFLFDIEEPYQKVAFTIAVYQCMENWGYLKPLSRITKVSAIRKQFGLKKITDMKLYEPANQKNNVVKHYVEQLSKFNRHSS